MTREHLDFPQGSPEWLASRLGHPTASEFATVLAQGRGGGDSKTRRKYMRGLCFERMTGQQSTDFDNAHMRRGREMEPEAREDYAFIRDVEVQPCGHVVLVEESGKIHCGATPDGFVGEDGLLEIKTKLPHLLIEVHETGDVPAEHVAQVQGQLWVTGRAWCDFFCYWPGMPPFLKRVRADVDYHKTILEPGLAKFNAELDELEQLLRSK